MFYRQTIRDAKIEDINDIIKLYDFWEEYNFIKDYERSTYKASYAGVEKTYYNVIYIFTTMKDDVAREDIYIAAQEVFSEEELATLRPHCACEACASYFWSRAAYCRDCIGCLHGKNPSNINVFNARVALNPNYKKNTEDKPKELEESMCISEETAPKVGMHRSCTMPEIQKCETLTSSC
jgi:hypothetical protein